MWTQKNTNIGKFVSVKVGQMWGWGLEPTPNSSGLAMYQSFGLLVHFYVLIIWRSSMHVLCAFQKLVQVGWQDQWSIEEQLCKNGGQTTSGPHNACIAFGSIVPKRAIFNIHVPYLVLDWSNEQLVVKWVPLPPSPSLEKERVRTAKLTSLNGKVQSLWAYINDLLILIITHCTSCYNFTLIQIVFIVRFYI